MFLLLVHVVGSVEQVDHRDRDLLQLLQVDEEAVFQHELDNLQDFQCHHVLSNFVNVLHSTRVDKIALCKLL